MDYDFFLLQETRISCKTQVDLIEKCFKGQCFWSFGIGKSAGVAIFVSPKFSGKIIRCVHDTDGRILSLLVDFNSFKFNIVCLYAPNTVTDRKLFFNRLYTFFLSPGDLILGGDFNCIDSELDRLHIKSAFSTDKHCLSALKSDFCRVDIFRKRNPKAISFTWSDKDFSQASRLDRFFFFLIFSVLFLFLFFLSFTQFVGTNVFLALSPITILSIYFFPRLMFLFTEAVFGNLTVLFFLMMILLVL